MKLFILLCMMLFIQPSYSQESIMDATRWVRNKAEGMKDSLADRPRDLIKTMSGEWVGKAQVNISSKVEIRNERDKFEKSWVGDVAVRVDGKSRLVLTLENGCKYNGEFVPFGSENTWSLEGQFERCSVSSLNRRLVGRMILKDGSVFVSLMQTAITIDPQVKILIRTTYLKRN